MQGGDPCPNRGPDGDADSDAAASPPRSLRRVNPQGRVLWVLMARRWVVFCSRSLFGKDLRPPQPSAKSSFSHLSGQTLSLKGGE